MPRPPFRTEGPALIVYDPGSPPWRRFVRRRGRVVGSITFGAAFTGLLALSALVAHRTTFAVVGSLLFAVAIGGLVLRALGHCARAVERRAEAPGVVLLGGHAADCWAGASTGTRESISARLWDLAGRLAETEDPARRTALVDEVRQGVSLLGEDTAPDARHAPEVAGDDVGDGPPTAS